MLSEHSQGKGRNFDAAPALLGFGFGLYIPVFLARSVCWHTGEDAPDLEFARGKSDVLPLQPQEFSTSESGHQRQGIQRFPFMPTQGFKEFLSLLDRQDLHLKAHFAWRLCQITHISCHESPLDRLT